MPSAESEAHHCESLAEVRAGIDRVDREIVALLAERGGYVRQAARFKRTTEDVKAPQRVELVIANVTALSLEMGADVSVTERVYRAMISAYIGVEMTERAALEKRVANPLGIQAIDHVTLCVRSVARAQKYYEEALGLTCQRAPVGGARGLRLENETVHFFLREDPDADPAWVREQHLSFEVRRLEPVIAYLDRRGEAYEVGCFDGFKRRNYRWCEWRDPEGIRVECVESLPGPDGPGAPP